MRNELSPEAQSLRKTADLLYSSRSNVREEAKAELIAAGENAIPFLKDIVSGKEADRLSNSYDDMISIPGRYLPGVWVKPEAAELLVKMGEPALPVLVELLQSKEETTREAVVRVLRLERISEQTAAMILPLLEHKSEVVRFSASSVLSLYDSPEVVDGFRATLKADVERLSKQRRRKMWHLKLMGIMYLAGLLTMLLTYGKNWGSYINVLLHFFNIFGSFFIFGGLSAASHEAIRAIQGKFDARMLGILLMCLRSSEGDIRILIQQELKRIMGEVKMNDRQYLNDEEMKILLKELDGKDEALTVAILKGLEQIGDERALPYVERLAQKANPKRRRTVKEILFSPIGVKKPDASEFVTVSEAAQACLPYLHQRIAEAQVSSTLLRASCQTEVSSSEELLRPATANMERHEAELLRATSG